MEPIQVYTDGSCRPRNPGNGGSAAIILSGTTSTAISAFIGNKSTNNKAELCAIKLGLEYILDKNLQTREVHVLSDSAYALNSVAGQYRGVTNLWLINSCKELIKEIPNLRLFHIYGHKGHKWNEFCDKLAYLAALDSVPKQITEFSTSEELENEILALISEKGVK